MSPIHLYYDEILNGIEVVSRKVRILYQFAVENWFKNPKYEYRADLANYAVDFIEDYCRHSKGAAGGKPFILELWQKAAICLIFGFVHVDTILRKHKVIHLIVGRKNGKSTFAAAISLYMLVADGESGPEIYAVATKKDQAKIIWKEAVKMINKSPKLRKLCRTRVGDVISDFNEGEYKALGRDSETLDGLNPSAATMDEIEAWTDMNMYDVIVDGMSARDNWLVLLTSTAGPVRDAVWDKFYQEGKEQINGYTKGEDIDNTTLYIIYELDTREEWRDPLMWKKANPGLGTIKRIDALERKVNAAKRDPSKIRNLVMKEFNVPETHASAWLNLEEIRNDATFDISELKPKYALGGFDLSETTDLTCATMTFMVAGDETIYQKQMYWIPEDTMDIRIEEDKVPYRLWEQQGYLRTSPGNRINHKLINLWFLEMQDEYNVYFFAIGYDRWSANYLVEEMEQTFGKKTMEAVAQGAKTLSAPMFEYGANLKSKKINYDNNPIFEWCCTNVKVETDKNGNIQPVKVKQSRVRIDGFVSALDAYVALDRNREDYLGMIGA